ncbi:MAG TPA: hypothetical protein VJS44_09170 [Pyrinomonadaceae bacterium]|nr:hypothetical protein [Pyrinomonadaceae bacterium]
MQVTLSQKSYLGPALVQLNSELILGWTDTKSYLNLSSSSDYGQNWGVQTTSSQKSASAPALAVLGEVLYIAWVGTDSKSSLNVMQTSDLKTFPVQEVINESAHSTSGPALAVFKDVLYIAWTGTNSQLNVAQIVNNIPSNIVTLEVDSNYDQQSHTSPALAADDDYLYIAWTGLPYVKDSAGNIVNDIITAPADALTGGSAGGTDYASPYIYLMRSSDGSNFSGLVNTHETSDSTNGPALTVSGSNLILGWTGSDSSGYLNTMYSTDQGQSFTGKETDTSNTSDLGPALSGEMIAWTGTDNSLNLKQGV